MRLSSPSGHARAAVAEALCGARTRGAAPQGAGRRGGGRCRDHRDLRVIDLTGVLADAVLGGAMARAARLDPVGFGGLAILSGLGGGLLRETLLQQGTPATSATVASGGDGRLLRTRHLTIGLAVATVTGAGLTLLARYRGWQLPGAYAWRPGRRPRGG